MKRIAYILLLVVLVVEAAMIFGTSGSLPGTVASHFAAGGRPNGWLPRDAYLAVMLGIGIGLPVLILASLAWLPRIAPSLVNVPHREYWLAEPRREDTLDALAVFGCLIGVLTASFVIALHFLLLDANARAPARLDESPLLAVTGIFVAMVIALIIAMFTRFRSGPRRA
jgi:hypothetical protein